MNRFWEIFKIIISGGQMVKKLDNKVIAKGKEAQITSTAVLIQRPRKKKSKLKSKKTDVSSRLKEAIKRDGTVKSLLEAFMRMPAKKRFPEGALIDISERVGITNAQLINYIKKQRQIKKRASKLVVNGELFEKNSETVVN